MPKVNFTPIDDKQVELDLFMMSQGFILDGDNVFYKKEGWFYKKRGMRIHYHKDLNPDIAVCDMLISDVFKIASQVEKILGKQVEINDAPWLFESHWYG